MRDFEGRAYYPLDLEAIPKGWTCAFVGEVCSEIQSGFASGEHNATGKGVPHLRPMNIDRAGRLDMSVIKSVAAEVDARRLHLGDVLFNNTNSPVLVGKTAAISRDGKIAFSNHMTRLRPVPEVDYVFLAHQLHFLWMGGYFLHRCSKHVNQASISADTLASSVPVVVPPASEQRLIVDAIDSCLTRLDDAVASLERARAKLKAYRASVLKAAVEGRLVPTEASLARAEGRDYEPAESLLVRILKERRRSWERAELAKLKAGGKTPKDDRWKGKYKEPAALDASILPELPEGWSWASPGQVFSWASGEFLPKKVQREGSIPVYGGNGVNGFHDEALIEASTIVVGRVGAHCGNLRVTVGRSWITDNAIYAVSPVAEANLGFWLIAMGRQDLNANAGGTGQPYVNQRHLDELRVPLPPTSEQSRIVIAADALLSKAEHVEKEVSLNILRCVRLRQAILKWAFEGKLADQDPADEPAEKLLTRIRAERAAIAPAKKNDGRRAKGAA